MGSETGNNRSYDELTPQERRFAVLYTQGLSQTQAYREAFNRPRIKASTASARASEVANKPRVRGYVKELFRALKKSDLMSQSEYLAQLFADRELCIEKDNMTAAMAANRLIGQALGTLSETMRIEDEKLTEAQLLERLGSNDPVLAERIKALTKAKQQFDA
jgi:phage terminase small subunit